MIKLGLIAGEGHLPVCVAEDAKNKGYDVTPFAFGDKNCKALKEVCSGPLVKIIPGLLRKNLELLQANHITHIVFAGKANKWTLLRNPQIDDLARSALKEVSRLTDDSIMLWLIHQMEAAGMTVLNQTEFLEALFEKAAVFSSVSPTEQQWRDMDFGFDMAREMGRLDIGQSIVVKDGLILAVEAIEGTDECMKRAGKLARKKGGVVVKVEKPEQDKRFDVPTVGLKTLKVMKRYGLNCLAVEANKTLILEKDDMIAFANKHNMVFASVDKPFFDQQGFLLNQSSLSVRSQDDAVKKKVIPLS